MDKNETAEIHPTKKIKNREPEEINAEWKTNRQNRDGRVRQKEGTLTDNTKDTRDILHMYK